jgi:hypothetical protein
MAIDTTRYFIDDVSSLSEALAENLGGESLTPSMLTQIKVPAGGATKWEIPTIEEETESVREIEGVILSFSTSRAYWTNPNAGDRVPPICSSGDMVTGIGTPGGSCKTCPFAQFGSASTGRGQACKTKMIIFLVRPGETLPVAVNIPATSITAIKSYLMHLTVAKLPFYAVTTKLTLQKVENKGGQAYSQVKAVKGVTLTSEDRAMARQFKDALASVLITPAPRIASAHASSALPAPPALTSHVNAEDL